MNLTEKFIQHPAYLKKGAGYLSKQFKCSIEDIQKAKQEAKGSSAKMISSNRDKDLFEVISDRPLTPKEIDEYAKVDNITSFVTNYWLKSHNSGKYTYSVQVKKIIDDFYSKEELENKLKELIPDIKPYERYRIEDTSDDVLMIYISDIHAGAQNSDNIHNLEYSEDILMERLEAIITKILNLNKSYKQVVVVNLGDSVDGWDGMTTRKGHNLNSLSNKDQFDIYFRCMTNFYSSLFESDVSPNFTVINCLNDNHPGIQFSYICNKSVQLVLEQKYPFVEFIQQEKFIDTYQIGNHIFAFCHGKDEGIMKYPMKKTLDDRLDLWAMQYFLHNGYNDHWKHIVKGDLHVFGYELGKFGTYMNVPSIYGTSDYISLNYGIGRPGAILEELNPEIEETKILPIWF